MKPIIHILAAILLPAFGNPEAAGGTYYGTDHVLSAPPAEAPGSTAVHMSNSTITAWADGYAGVQYGTDVAEEWKQPGNALGPAQGISEEVVCLGRGGQITLTFSGGIADGPGADFAVFENGFDDYFLELAYVEVSSDGINFVRFPNYSYTTNPVEAFGTVYTELIFGLASKYRRGYGTPFDLNELQIAYEAQLAGNTDFSGAFAAALTNTFPLLDLNHITHVRLVDAVGDGTALDARGQVVYDPYPTLISAGFDLDAVGVIHPAGPLAGQHIFVEPLPNQAKGGTVSVQAYASSGLPVALEVLSGPASVEGSLLTLSNLTGTVQLRASQGGDSVFGPAADVTVEFESVEAGASNAPLTLDAWAALHAVPGDGQADSDNDGVIDFQEFIMGGNPNQSADAPAPAVSGGIDAEGQPAVTVEYILSRRALGTCRIAGSPDLAEWTRAVPEIVEAQYDADLIRMRVRLPAADVQRYYRLIFGEQ
jgi:hypothetical protein